MKLVSQKHRKPLIQVNEMNRLKKIIVLLLLVSFSSCTIHSATIPMVDEYSYYLNPDKDLSAVGRVAVVELDNNSSYPQVSADATEALFQALQKKQIFGLTVVRQSAPAGAASSWAWVHNALLSN